VQIVHEAIELYVLNIYRSKASFSLKALEELIMQISVNRPNSYLLVVGDINSKINPFKRLIPLNDPNIFTF
jgi:hypothetical protein